MTPARLSHVDALRGIAALAVVWFHLTGSAGLSPETASLGRYGYLGVEVFFAISGFIIPYSMVRRQYRPADFGMFLFKRILRLDPPYLAAIVLAVILPAVTMGGSYVWPTVPQLLAHLGYANAVLGLHWLSPVFWTLAIEFQFYLFMGLAYALVAHPRDRVAVPALALCALTPLLVSSKAFLPHWAGLFVLGALTFRRLSFRTEMIPLLVVGGLAAGVTAVANGVPEAIAGLVTLGAVSFGGWLPERAKWARPLLWLGTVSYSLYLTHWAFGVTGVAVARHLPLVGGSELVRAALGVATSLAVAGGFYAAVERPAIEWASRIRYGPRRKAAEEVLKSPNVSDAEVW